MLMLPLCCGRNEAFVGDILQMRRWFGTEGSVVQIHSPRPKLIKKIGLRLTARRRLKAIFVGDSGRGLSELFKSFRKTRDPESAITGRRGSNSVDFGGKVLP